MTRATFYISEGIYTGFKIEGHALLSTTSPDVLCAAISGMTNLVINTLSEVFGVTADFNADEKVPCIEYRFVTCPDKNIESMSGVIKGFCLQIKDLENQYPKHLCVTVQQNTTKGNKEND